MKIIQRSCSKLLTAFFLIIGIVLMPATKIMAMPPSCDYGFLISNKRYEAKHIPEIPTNVGALLWKPDVSLINDNPKSLLPHVMLMRADDPKEQVPVFKKQWDKNNGIYLIIPENELQPGVEYVLSATNLCKYYDSETPSLNQKFLASQNHSLPAYLGDLSQSETEYGWAFEVHGCFGVDLYRANKEFQLNLSSDFAPWADAAFISMIIDDESIEAAKLVSYENALPKISATIKTVCLSNEGYWGMVGEGKHKVRFQAELPNTDVLLSTPEIEFEMACDLSGALDGSFIPDWARERLAPETSDTKDEPSQPALSGPDVVDEPSLPALSGPDVLNESGSGCSSKKNTNTNLCFLMLLVIFIFQHSFKGMSRGRSN